MPDKKKAKYRFTAKSTESTKEKREKIRGLLQHPAVAFPVFAGGDARILAESPPKVRQIGITNPFCNLVYG
jgi:hypothetical protein